jgi:hypothetical protein
MRMFCNFFFNNKFLRVMGTQLKAIATNSYDEVKMAVDALAADAEKFYAKGNAAAGTRLRMGLQEVAKLVKLTRVEVSRIKNEKGEEKASA